ncbi:bifunctional alpha/beta hydrolase/class I SAM-dependent methyltransferase [Methylotenera sp. N17]|uniref:bifunctional alpha/beta hydrolase/class I SAM-dependent methyltransferase n=1 Tax=Methylotenera sp. N17 TaxID=1502761 RepID=UPI00064925FE|nr:bifunctional alpha/beta hydrolase/class I SAM-dependent methyltransferase [Methylotenera sp. N17]
MLEKRIAQEQTFSAVDGAEIFYRHWPSKQQTAHKRAIILFHRGHEHSGRQQDVVDSLNMPDYDCFAWDARGLGKSPGVRGYADNFGLFAKDADVFARHICQKHGFKMEDIAVIAQSVGGVIAATWVHDYAPNIRCLVLASPALKVKLYVPFARTALGAIQALGLTKAIPALAFVNSYVKAKWLTHDTERIASYEIDPLITRPIAVNILLELYETAERLLKDAAAITTPTQFLISGSDWVVHQKPVQALFKKLGSKTKEYHVFDGFFHDTLGEKDRHLPLTKAREFIQSQFATPFAQPDLTKADITGFTHDEVEQLKKPLSLFNPKNWYFAATRLNIRLGSQTSKGLKLALDTGFDSGSSLDYVYENEARGSGFIGRLIDRTYLDAIGWRGIRIRKQHIEALAIKAATLLRADNQPVRMMDIAAGHGRYVLHTALAVKADYALLRDYSELNVTAGRAMIKQLSLESTAHFELADAFDAPSIAAMTPKPTLAIVSGLYELFPENAPVQSSLSGIYQALDSGGYLVYTNQPWHPQLELIARTLTSHRQNKAWVMRRRTQQEIDQLVSAAGFEKVDQWSDTWGIFSVSLARRR